MWCGRAVRIMSNDSATNRLKYFRRRNGFELGKSVGMIRLHVFGDFCVSQKFFDIAPRHRQIEQVFSVDIFGGLDVSLLRFYFPLHAGVEIRLFNLFHGFE
jgi:hypothetical protein